MEEKFSITIDMGSFAQFATARAAAAEKDLGMEELFDMIADRLLEIEPPYAFEVDKDFEAEIELQRSTVRNAFIEMKKNQLEAGAVAMAALKFFSVEISRRYNDKFGAYPGADYPENGVKEVSEISDCDGFKLFKVPWVPTGVVCLRLENAYLYAASEADCSNSYTIPSYEFKQFDSVDDAVDWIHDHTGREWVGQEPNFHIGKEAPNRPKRTIHL